jgi:hypothetical protein
MPEHLSIFEEADCPPIFQAKAGVYYVGVSLRYLFDLVIPTVIIWTWPSLP